MINRYVACLLFASLASAQDLQGGSDNSDVVQVSIQQSLALDLLHLQPPIKMDKDQTFEYCMNKEDSRIDQLFTRKCVCKRIAEGSTDTSGCDVIPGAGLVTRLRRSRSQTILYDQGGFEEGNDGTSYECGVPPTIVSGQQQTRQITTRNTVEYIKELVQIAQVKSGVHWGHIQNTSRTLRDEASFQVTTPPNDVFFCPLEFDGPCGQLQRMLYSIVIAVEHNISACLHDIFPHYSSKGHVLTPICKVFQCDSPAIMAVGFDGSTIPSDTLVHVCDSEEPSCFEASIVQRVPVVVAVSRCFYRWSSWSRVLSMGPSLFRVPFNFTSKLAKYTCLHLRISDRHFDVHNEKRLSISPQSKMKSVLDTRQRNALMANDQGQRFLKMSVREGLDTLQKIAGRPLYVMTAVPGLVDDPEMLTLDDFSLDTDGEDIAHLDRALCSQCGKFISATGSQFSGIVEVMRGVADGLQMDQLLLHGS